MRGHCDTYENPVENNPGDTKRKSNCVPTVTIMPIGTQVSAKVKTRLSSTKAPNSIGGGAAWGKPVAGVLQQSGLIGEGFKNGGSTRGGGGEADQ